MRFAPTLSPLNQRRWRNFKANRRGYYALWVFIGLFSLTLFAELIANDKPLLMRFQGAFYMPIFVAYAETEFGGDFETEADYRDIYVRELIEADGWMVWPPIRYSYDTINLDLKTAAPAPPNSDNWLGTDDQGRDVTARLIYGFRISVLFGLTLTFFSALIGIAAGAVQGYFGGRTDLLFQRFIEIWTSVPSLYLLIIIAAVIEPGFWILLGILLLFSWVALVGVVRAEFLRARNFEYVQAAHALGVGNLTIMWRHLLPNAMVATLTFLPFILNASITTLTSLDFLGFGLPPGSPSLGELLAQGKANLHAPWLGLAGFATIAIMLSLLIFIGESVRDAFDPRKTFQHTA
ncbi:MAG: ABC transporter permease [Alphaproteobacteria bacterium]|nr:ABC transporter permease [Alphaproteobacteria bacterium]